MNSPRIARELAARFDAARRRGDSVHRREEARFRLDVENDIAGRAGAREANWNVQREPADLRILADAARASGETRRALEPSPTGSRPRGSRTSRRRSGRTARAMKRADPDAAVVSRSPPRRRRTRPATPT